MDTQRIKDEGYFGAFGDAYGLLKDMPEDIHTSEYWGMLGKKGNEIVRRYEGTPAEKLSRELVIAVMEEIERLYEST